jgi:tetratricopeptide (TPR) repeat protein
MPDDSHARPIVMVSSTALDLPTHRKEVLEACLRQSTIPKMQEHLPASSSDAASGAEAIRVSLEMVDEADIYLGVFAHRYGYVPAGHDISITEMEYNRAVERGLTRLIFLMHDQHPVLASDVETGEGALKLKRLKERLKTENVVNFFNSPEDLRAHVINSLSQYREQHGKRDIEEFHYISDIPKPPEAYIAHPYTLLHAKGLIGRQEELNLLTDWVTKPNEKIYQARVLNIVAIGGMGKSALTWKWFNDIAPHEMKPLKGRIWWSFYESDARYENFIVRTLAYVTERPREEVQKIPLPDCEEQLLAALDNEPFLVVLDGLERLLIAYARMDAARLSDDDFDEKTANRVANARGLPESAAQSFTGQHNLRKTADPRVGAFLRKLATRRSSRILITTRLYPRELQDKLTDEAIPGSYPYFLLKLSDDDALNLWRTFEVGGSREELLHLFHTFGNHALLIKALSGEIKRYKRAPGDFETWRQHHPKFDPSRFPILKDLQAHVIEFALRGLDEKARQTLHTIAAFRMPAAYETLLALLVGEGKLFVNDSELDAALNELEDRGLLGWDKRANRYDLHPIVRGVVWSGLDDNTRRGVYMSLQAHFEALPLIDDYLKVNSLEDLTPAIELYNTLIGLERYDDAYVVFRDRLESATHFRLSANLQRVELLEMFFTDGLDQLPRLSDPIRQAFTLITLAHAYHFSGQPGRAAPLYRRADAIYSGMKHDDYRSVGLYSLSTTLQPSGVLFESESTARHALLIARAQNDSFDEAYSLYLLGLTLAVRGSANESNSALQRSLRTFVAQNLSQGEGVITFFLAQTAFWLGESTVALSLANRAWELAQVLNYKGDFIRAARVQGEAALALNDLAVAGERLHYALTRARMVNFVEEELSALVALAELQRRQRDLRAAREFLDDVWEAAESGPYPLIHADACNVLAQIERDGANQEKAIEAATKAYRLAWCDGPPFAYHWGLEKARKHLRELGAEEPQMPPFDESLFEPMPEVEINPPDEFGGQES